MIFIDAILFNLFDAQRNIERIFFYYLPSVEVELGVHCPLSFIQDIEAKVVRLNNSINTYSIGR